MDISIDNNSESLSDIDAIAVGIAATKTKASSHKSSYKSTDALEKYKADKEKDKKAQGKAREKEEKTREKDAEKERKRIAKEERARYKESATFLAEANKLKTDKKISTPEMIVVLPSSLENKLKDAILVFMLELSVKTEEYQSTLPVVKWKRKTEAEWDPEAQYFRPCELKIIEEKHIIYVMAAKEFVQLATGEEGNDLDCHVLRLKTKYEDCQIIYLIEGLAKWQKKNKDIKNKAYTDAVRSHLSAAETSTSSSERAKKKYEVYVDDDVIERELLKLQVIHGVLIHHSVVAENTPEWIRSFTQHISTIPYKMQQRSMDTSFCMEQGQVKAGTDTKDTFIKMLGEITRITSPIALGISNKFPTVQKLVKGLKEEGPLALMELRTMANRDGAYADRRIGKAISRRVHTVFTSRDEWREDV
ncbi:ERCC4 domain-containing protein [Calycina marina]|uniref:ERCC4 domain-containing protein n=1 Tax=Calycina marina TaxID=1763456 RepID=A0A9P8CF03_9HELO|nr:ERCC4 domain-containing protein [Calycina marina]